MKRLYFTVVALLGMTMTFAGNKNDITTTGNNNNAETAVTTKNDNQALYDISYNLRRLGETLGLTIDQMNSVEVLNRKFRIDMNNAGQADKAERSSMLNEAVAKDRRYMSYVLTPEQLEKYETLINTTLENRGLEK